jgi:hypothetical protein
MRLQRLFDTVSSSLVPLYVSTVSFSFLSDNSLYNSFTGVLGLCFHSVDEVANDICSALALFHEYICSCTTVDFAFF